MIEKWVEGFAKAILDKYADPIIKHLSAKAKEEWEKFRIDFDIAFVEYLNNAFEKYSKVKTILYKAEPQYLYDFFEVPYLERGTGEIFLAKQVDTILDVSHYIIIKGTGGIGKSTLMKHLFINEITNKDLIPIYIELKDVNDFDSLFSLSDIVYQKLTNLGSNMSKQCLDYALKSGCFLFLLDGYDEILTIKKKAFLKDLDAFCDKYPNNFYILSSRPCSDFIELQRFSVLSTRPFSKAQAISLVNRINYDEEIKNRFIIALEQELYEKHESFASNPLLLSIMLLTFDNYAEIPSKLHLFYANAFETLFEKHDATKAGYRREIKSGLPYDSFRRVFSYFCFYSYAQGRIEFSRDDLIDVFKKIHIAGIAYDSEDFIYDLINSLCVLYRDGLTYRFTHRSFQEYFTAFFLKELSDNNMSRLGISLIEKDAFRASHDNVFPMLRDMTEDRFESNILLPLIRKYENGDDSDKYKFYFKKIIKGIELNIIMNDGEEIPLAFCLAGAYSVFEFLYDCSHFYMQGTASTKKGWEDGEKAVLEYIKANGQLLFDEDEGNEISCDSIMGDQVLFGLINRTWVGTAIMTLSTLKNTLEEKQQNMAIDLTSLLP